MKSIKYAHQYNKCQASDGKQEIFDEVLAWDEFKLFEEQGESELGLLGGDGNEFFICAALQGATWDW